MPVEFSTFASYADEIEEASKNTVIIQHVAELLQETNSDIGIVARFIQGNVFPNWDERKTNIGPVLMRRSLADAAEESEETIEEKVAESGDTGQVAQSLTYPVQQRELGSSSLTVSSLYETLEQIADIEGEGSQKGKVKTIVGLLHKASPSEAKYITRLLLEELRIGVGEGTLRDALSKLYDVPSSEIARGIMVRNDIEEVAKAAKNGGRESVNELGMSIGRPVQPMLAQDGDVESTIDDWSKTISQTKYDGERIQVHVSPQEDWPEDVSLFSRNCEDHTESLPDAAEFVREFMSETEAIHDGEILAYDPDVLKEEANPEPMEFRKLLQRTGRENNIEEARDRIALQFRFFDVLYCEGSSTINSSNTDRWSKLSELVPEDALSEHRVVDSVEEVREHNADAMSNGHEGLVLKNPTAEYSPGKRGQNWRKIKPDIETLDCVVVGGEWGKGRRANTIGTYELAVRDSETGELLDIGNVATGLTDEQLEEFTTMFNSLIEAEDGKDLSF